MLLLYLRNLIRFWDVAFFSPLLKQVFDWATGGVVEISLD